MHLSETAKLCILCTQCLILGSSITLMILDMRPAGVALSLTSFALGAFARLLRYLDGKRLR
jgi:hypothetical protein